MIFAAASLSGVLEAVFEGADPAPRLSYGGSGAIARQVDQGAPADLVILANPLWMDWLEGRGHVQPDARSAPFGNRLVMVGPAGSKPLETLDEDAVLARLNGGRLAIGEHRAVPAGQYAAAWLDSLGLWNALRAHLAETENVRAALALVARGEAPLGIVYVSDLKAAPEAARAVWQIPNDQQPDIRYAMAPLTPRGADLAAVLSGAEAMAVFEAFGFLPLPEGGS